jgi:DNA polymerase III epsilon subunit-like protein
MPTLVLLFDVETTGLIPKGELILELCPYILQLSYIVFNMDTQKIEKKYNKYINIPSKIDIKPEIEKLTGITRVKCNNGVVITEALEALYNEYIRCNKIIAHNISFDSKMVRIELARNSGRKTRHLGDLLSTEFEKTRNIERFCTMENSITLCNIIVETIDKYGKPYQYKKFPKLSELHEKLFGSVPENLHDSMIDTLVCLRCYMKMVHSIIIDI